MNTGGRDVLIRIVVDTREQHPYTFSAYPDVEVIRAALPTGDFSLPGFEDRISLERKSLDDLIGCLSQSRARFSKELARARKFEMFSVICEFPLQDLILGRYRSHMKSAAVIASISAFSVRYRVPFLFCGNRAGGELMTYSLLSKFAREVRIRFEALEGPVSMVNSSVNTNQFRAG
jgi:ERCC4-type nuclease